MDTNNYNYQDLGQQGITLGQASDTVLQDTAGLGGTTDANGFFGTTANTNDIFGQTFKTNTDTGDFLTTQTNTDGNTLLGTTNNFQGTTTYGSTNTFTQPIVTPLENNTVIGINDTNALFSNPTLVGTQFLPTTTTTTNTTYGISASQPQITGQETFGSVDASHHYQSEYLATGHTKYDTSVFPDAPVGYGTTAADFAAANQVQTTTAEQTQTTYDVNPTSNTYVEYNTTNIPTTYENTVVETTTQPSQEVITTQVQNIPETQNQVIESPPYIFTPQENIIQTPQPQIIQTQFGRRIIDEDYRRGRPIYNDDFREFKLRQSSNNNNNNLPIRPSYNVGLYSHPHLFNYGYGGTGFGYNKLDKLARGSSYDVKVNSNLPKTSNIKDYL